MSYPQGAELDALKPCSQEEADTRMILHVAAATQEGHRDVVIRTSDSDVVVLAVWAAESPRDKLDQLWIALGTGRNFR